MNKSMLMGVVAGIGVATAGGVLGYQFLGPQGAEVEGDEVIVEAEALTPATPAPAVRTAAAPAARPRRLPPHRRVLGRGSPGDGRPEGSAPDRGHRDRRRGRRRDRQGSRRPRPDDGSRCGRRRFHRAQDPGEVQENRADERTTTTVERRCGPPGSAPR